MGFRWLVTYYLLSIQRNHLSAKRVIESVVELGDVDGFVVSLPAIRTIAFNHEVRVMW